MPTLIEERPRKAEPAPECIKCEECGWISFHPQDVTEKRCGWCHALLKEALPELREA